MRQITYNEAITEVLDVLKHTKKEDVDKIPKKFIQMLEENKSKTYKPQLDHSKTIKEMDLNSKTQAILGIIYFKYWANDKEKKEFTQKLQENEIKFQQELNKEFNVEELFKK